MGINFSTSLNSLSVSFFSKVDFLAENMLTIANCLLKRHPEPVKRNHIDEYSQQPFASNHSTCAQWGIPATTVAGKSVPASIFYNLIQDFFFMKRSIIHDDNMLLWQLL